MTFNYTPIIYLSSRQVVGYVILVEQKQESWSLSLNRNKVYYFFCCLWLHGLVVRPKWRMIRWSGFRYLSWSCDLGCDILHDPVILENRSLWSGTKKVVIPWCWSQNFHDHVILISKNFWSRIFWITKFHNPWIWSQRFSWSYDFAFFLNGP